MSVDVREAVRGTPLPKLAGVFASTYALDYGLFVLSWWLLGRAALSAELSFRWLTLWALLFAFMLPFRMLSTWSAGRIAVVAGGLLKRRLLEGAMRLEPDELRGEGVGRHLARVFESTSVETLALTGGLLAAAAGLELVVCFAILWSGAGGLLHVGLLGACLALLLLLVRSSFRERRLWADARLDMSHDLVERMVGHRTRLVQERPERWHAGEDEALLGYVVRSRRVDRLQAALRSLPRLWLVVAMIPLARPVLGGGAGLEMVAVGVGGAILASRALTKLTRGFSELLDALIAWERIAPLLRASSRSAPRGDAAARAAEGAPLVQARGVSYRYPKREEPALREVDFVLDRGDRVLLTSRSGGGKSTLVSLVNGLRAPASGHLLLEGLDRERRGASGWTRLVATAPQFHENHVFTASFSFNLLMGRSWPASGEDLKLAEGLCRELGLGPLLRKMPGGMSQLVGDTGWQLSHGEKSRLFLARALLQGGELVLLDESFAALDPENLRQALVCARERAGSLLVVEHV